MIAPTEFTDAYIAAALWAEEEQLNNDGVPADPAYLTNYSLKKMEHDCAIFWTAAKERIGTRVEQAGHDFWLTRNGHGTGFWDRPEVYGEEDADWLSELAKAFGEVNLLADDGQIAYE